MEIFLVFQKMWQAATRENLGEKAICRTKHIKFPHIKRSTRIKIKQYAIVLLI